MYLEENIFLKLVFLAHFEASILEITQKVTDQEKTTSPQITRNFTATADFFFFYQQASKKAMTEMWFPLQL